MIRVAVEFDYSSQDVGGALAILDALRAAAPQSPRPVPANAADWNVAKWFAHLGAGSRRFWEIAAGHALAHQTWTFDDLSAASGIDKEKLRSYHRNSYRAINDEGAHDPLGGQWDANNGRNVYTMPDAVRDEILRLVNVSEGT